MKKDTIYEAYMIFIDYAHTYNETATQHQKAGYKKTANLMWFLYELAS